MMRFNSKRRRDPIGNVGRRRFSAFNDRGINEQTSIELAMLASGRSGNSDERRTGRAAIVYLLATP